MTSGRVRGQDEEGRAGVILGKAKGASSTVTRRQRARTVKIS